MNKYCCKTHKNSREWVHAVINNYMGKGADQSIILMCAIQCHLFCNVATLTILQIFSSIILTFINSMIHKCSMTCITLNTVRYDICTSSDALDQAWNYWSRTCFMPTATKASNFNFRQNQLLYLLVAFIITFLKSKARPTSSLNDFRVYMAMLSHQNKWSNNSHTSNKW